MKEHFKVSNTFSSCSNFDISFTSFDFENGAGKFKIYNRGKSNTRSSPTHRPLIARSSPIIVEQHDGKSS